MEAQASKNDNFFAYREGFISTEVDEMFAGSDENKTMEVVLLKMVACLMYLN